MRPSPPENVISALCICLEIPITLGGDILEDLRFCRPVFRARIGRNSQLTLESLEIDLIGLGGISEVQPGIHWDRRFHLLGQLPRL